MNAPDGINDLHVIARRDDEIVTILVERTVSASLHEFVFLQAAPLAYRMLAALAIGLLQSRMMAELLRDTPSLVRDVCELAALHPDDGSFADLPTTAVVAIAVTCPRE